ncbi:MAG: hypothetical protein M3Y77_10775 [Actinomycetota bacterium]|nr:hypothetical protein [Actinomycetota bacterium]
MSGPTANNRAKNTTGATTAGIQTAGWIVDSPESSTTGTVSPAKAGKVDVYFWVYPSGNSALGSLRYSPGGAMGNYGWAPVGIGSACSFTYVTYVFNGLRNMPYRARAYVPDVDNLTTIAEYDGAIVNQAAHPGKWVELGNLVPESTSVGYSAGVTIQQPYQPDGQPSGCKASTKKIAFDAVEIQPAGGSSGSATGPLTVKLGTTTATASETLYDISIFISGANLGDTMYYEIQSPAQYRTQSGVGYCWTYPKACGLEGSQEFTQSAGTPTFNWNDDVYGTQHWPGTWTIYVDDVTRKVVGTASFVVTGTCDCRI